LILACLKNLLTGKIPKGYCVLSIQISSLRADTTYRQLNKKKGSPQGGATVAAKAANGFSPKGFPIAS
jgi:hypothetical protein